MNTDVINPRGEAQGASDASVTVHEQTYQAIREQILFGGFLPGKPVTLRGLAGDLGVSMMPVRDAVRRLIAERALERRDNRRVAIPDMTRTRFREIMRARSLLEPELAALAFPHIDADFVGELRKIDDTIDASIATGDIPGYMRGNYAFHFRIYDRADAPVIRALVESLWLQFGPFMRLVYGRMGTSTLADRHVEAVDAMERRDEAGLRAAIEADIHQGMTIIGESAL